MMYINAHRGRQRLRTLIISTLAITALRMLVGTAITRAQAPTGGGKQAVVTVQGMQCPFCAYGIKKHLAKLPSATRVVVELAKNQAIITFASDANVTDAQIQQAIRKAGFTPGRIEWQSGGQTDKAQGTEAAERKTAILTVEGMRCLRCEAKITADSDQLPAVRLAQVDWQTRLATVRCDARTVKPNELIHTIERAGNFQAKLKTSKG